eukprot:scaffold895_cov315-Pinguiococcus_pyrenoidosus.AAC.37
MHVSGELERLEETSPLGRAMQALQSTTKTSAFHRFRSTAKHGCVGRIQPQRVHPRPQRSFERATTRERSANLHASIFRHSLQSMHPQRLPSSSLGIQRRFLV